MSANVKVLKNYEHSIELLNQLQSNAVTIEKMKREGRSKRTSKVLHRFEEYFAMSDLKLNDLDKLNVIHVAGTKGKGSTCAITESILRSEGFKTGFFSSPHLVSVRERIRIKGQPLSEQQFCDYFFEVHSKLSQAVQTGEPLPSYFAFLTILAFHIFLKEQVDVAIIEVGIGGRYDSTNIVRNPIITAVTTLDLDHQAVLGNTIEEIAYQKAGIFKKNIIALSVPQEKSAMAVLENEAKTVNANFYVVPPVTAYAWPNGCVSSGIPGASQTWNIALALQICKLWMDQRDQSGQPPVYDPPPVDNSIHQDASFRCLRVLRPFHLKKSFRIGLKECRWPGRSQIIRKRPIVYFIDGAHTPKSIEYCSEWFKKASTQELTASERVIRILVFNCTGDRAPQDLLPFLVKCDFDFAVFCPNTISYENDPRAENSNLMTTREIQLKKCEKSRDAWIHVLEKQDLAQLACDNAIVSSLSAAGHTSLPFLSNSNPSFISHTFNQSLYFAKGRSVVLASVNEAFDFIRSTLHESSEEAFPCEDVDGDVDDVAWHHCRKPVDQVHVLITGSLHLVGAFMSKIDPELRLR